MTDEIEQWERSLGNGEYETMVRHSDHIAAMQAKDDRIAELESDMPFPKLRQRMAAMRSEVESLRAAVTELVVDRAKLRAENEMLRVHLGRILLAQDGVPLNALEFGKWVQEARADLQIKAETEK